jgi:hypothetical protein
VKILARVRTDRISKRKYPINVGEVEVVRVGGNRFLGVSREHPYKIVSTLKDGRRFQVRVNALTKNEAQRIFNEKLPLAVIKSISRADKLKTAESLFRSAERYLES